MIQTERQAKPKTTVKKVNVWKTPKMTVIIFLVLLMGIAAAYSGTYRGLLSTAVSVAAAVIVDLAAGRIQRIKSRFPDGAIITGLIVALVLSYSEPWYIEAITSVFAISSKHLLRVSRKPFFNPAAFGLLLTILIFGSGEDWWGSLADMPLWCLAIVGIGGYWIARKTNKFPQVFSFLGTYFAILLVLGLLHTGQIIELYQAPFVNAILFLSFIMVTDPPTSPPKVSGQIGFGMLAALFSIAWNFYYGGTSFLLVGLLCTNLLHILLYAADRNKKPSSSRITV